MSTQTLDTERFPIGKFQRPAAFTAELRAENIANLRNLPAKLTEAASGLNDQQLDTPYRDGGWTVRQLVHHVADSHANAYIRFKLALTEANPTIKPYNEKEWAHLADSRLSVDVSLRLVAGIHTRWIALLESMNEADFERGFVHPDNGPQSLNVALAIYSWHSLHHTAHITRLRERQGW